MDTVVQFPDKVARNPARFGAETPAETEVLVKRLRAELDAELTRRTFEYIRSNGVAHTLSLKDVTSRATGFEMAYNPNDCVERRWAAPKTRRSTRAVNALHPRSSEEKCPSIVPGFKRGSALPGDHDPSSFLWTSFPSLFAF